MHSNNYIKTRKVGGASWYLPLGEALAVAACIVCCVVNELPPLVLVKVVGAEFSVILDVMDENILVS